MPFARQITSLFCSAQRPMALSVRAWMVWVVTVMVWGMGTLAVADNIAVVTGPSTPPFDAARTQIKQYLEGKGHQVQMITVGTNQAAVQLTPGTSTVVAVGAAITNWLNDRLPKDLPLVCCMLDEPHHAKLNNRPNLFGITVNVPIADQIKLMRATRPALRTIGMVYNSDHPESVAGFHAMRDALPEGIALNAIAVNEFTSTAAAFRALLNNRIDFVWTTNDPAVFDYNSTRALLLHAFRRGVPIYGFSLPFVKAGAVVGVGINPADHGLQTGELAHRVATKDPAIVNAPDGKWRTSRYQIGIHHRMARLLRIRISRELREQADVIIGEN